MPARVGGAGHNEDMSQPPTLGHRPVMPPPGASDQERIVARFHGHARRLFWSALVLVAVAGAVGLLWGNLPEPFANWMLLAGGAAVVVLLVLIPWFVWLSRSYTITTRRVIARRGVFARRRREYAHARGYGIQVRRGPIQRMWRAGTITLVNGVDQPLVLRNIPDAGIVQEVLADQVEVSQILAHRDAQSGSMSIVPDLPIPPPPPLPAR